MSTSPERVLIFCGAGASCAVNSNSYPTTVGFFSKLDDSIKSNALVQALLPNLEKKFGSNSPDIEKILWCLGELKEYFNKVQNPSSPISWFIPNNQLPSLIGSSNEVSSYAACSSKAEKEVDKLVEKINAEVYRLYSEEPCNEDIESNWLPFLRKLEEKNVWVDIITTNYDLVIETAIDALEIDIGYGKPRKGPVSRLEIGLWKNTDKIAHKRGMLTKLHGSINWENDKGSVVFGGTGFKTSHSHHAVIYPGFKGIPSDEPFVSMHQYFEYALKNANKLVFIGFAFRDDYVNALLKSIKSDAKIYIIDPEEKPFPVDMKNNPIRINQGFDREAVDVLNALL